MAKEARDVRNTAASSPEPQDTIAHPLPWSSNLIYATKVYLLYSLNAFLHYVRFVFEDHVEYTEHPPTFSKTYACRPSLPIR